MADATGDYLSADEVEELTGEEYPLEYEGPVDFPPDEGETETELDEDVDGRGQDG